ncbi:MAG: aminotransferase class V-fold PLP-dependent enzyme [Bryobacteraceae bacterium]
MNRRLAISHLTGVPALFALRDMPLPEASLAERSPEKYWARIRKEQFYLPEQRVFMNNGSLGVAPRPVIRAVVEFLEKGAGMQMPDFEYPRWGYEALDAHRQEMSQYLGCRKDDLAFTHNATEALSFIANGIDLQPGDEVVMTDQEHGSGKAGWHLRKARYGIAVREVKIPLPPPDPGKLADLMVSSIGPRTKVLFFSGITTATGLIFPMKEICAAARAKGVITVIDGAHVNGQLPVKIAELGCDYYAGSPHKWMFAPAGCGILWGRPEMLERLWPVTVTGGWEVKDRGAARFQGVGTNNRAIFEGMLAGVRFANSIGPDKIYTRIHDLAKIARKRSEEMGFHMLTPDNDQQYGSLVTMELKGVDIDKFRRLCHERKIWTIGGPRLRISTHIHTRVSDLDALFETLKESRS